MFKLVETSSSSSRKVELKISDETYILKKVYNILYNCDRVSRVSARFGPDDNEIYIVMKNGTKRVLTLKKYEGEEK